MPDYINMDPGTIPNASGYPGHSECEESCLDATEIMIERCPEKSIAFAVTSQNATFGKDGKIKITEEHYDTLRAWYADGKMTPGNHRKTRHKVGSRRVYYDMIKRDWLKEQLEGDQCSPDLMKRVQNFTDQLARAMNREFINSHMCGTSKRNIGCNDCVGIFDNIGTDQEAYCIEYGKGCSDGMSAMQCAGEQFVQYLINVQAVGDNLPDNCDGKQYVMINSCFKPMMKYLEHAKKASCESTCALADSLRPITDNAGTMPDVYFSKDVPMTTINGAKASAVLAGYYDDDFLVPEPVRARMNVPGPNTAMFDQWFYSFQYANARPDRKWGGFLTIKEKK